MSTHLLALGVRIVRRALLQCCDFSAGATLGLVAEPFDPILRSG